MNRRQLVLALVAGAAVAGAWSARPGLAQAKKRVLVITHAAGFKHDTRALGAQTVKELGEATGKWEVVGVAEDQSQVQQWINADGLKKVDLAPRCGRKPSSGPFRG